MAAVAHWLSFGRRPRTVPTFDLATSNDLSSGGVLRAVLGSAALLASALAAAGVVLYLPFYVSFDSQAGGILPITGPATRHFLFLVVMGVPAVLTSGLIARSVLEMGWPSRSCGNWPGRYWL